MLNITLSKRISLVLKIRSDHYLTAFHESCILVYFHISEIRCDFLTRGFSTFTQVRSHGHPDMTVMPAHEWLGDSLGNMTPHWSPLSFQSTHHVKTLWGKSRSPHECLRSFCWHLLVRWGKHQHLNRALVSATGKKILDNSEVLFKKFCSPSLLMIWEWHYIEKYEHWWL